VDYSGTGVGTYANGNVINTKAVTNSAPAAVYQSERNGNFSYVVPDLIPGLAYKVRLHFAEIYWSSVGQRVFDVAINGTPVLQRFDIIAAAGAPNTAIVREFTATADNNGQITIVYTTDTDRAKSSGIEVIAPGQVPDPPAPPLNTVSRYMMTTLTGVLKSEGCTAGRQSTGSSGKSPYAIPDGIVVLDFGQPSYTATGTISGTILFNSGNFASTTDISKAAEAFLDGYWNCTPANGPFLTLVVGTSNLMDAQTSPP